MAEFLCVPGHDYARERQSVADDHGLVIIVSICLRVNIRPAQMDIRPYRANLMRPHVSIIEHLKHNTLTILILFNRAILKFIYMNKEF